MQTSSYSDINKMKKKERERKPQLPITQLDHLTYFKAKTEKEKKKKKSHCYYLLARQYSQVGLA
jgi:competence protein ComGF